MAAPGPGPLRRRPHDLAALLLDRHEDGEGDLGDRAPTAVELYSADLGIEMAHFNDDLAFGLPNGIGPEVTQMIDTGVDFIIACDSLNQITYRADSLINPINWTRQHNPVVEGVPDYDYELECVSYVRMEGGGFVGFQPAPWMCNHSRHKRALVAAGGHRRSQTRPHGP